MSDKKITLRNFAIIGMILIAVFARLIPHIPNFTPVGAIALFGAAYFSKKYLAFIIPFAALWISSLIIDNTTMAAYYEGFQWFSNPMVYIAFFLIVLLGFFTLRKVSVLSAIGSGIGASVIFFLVSNIESWLTIPVYTKDLTGLMACYTAALPFFANTLTGDLVYVGVLFGGFELLKRTVPQMQTATAHQ